MVNITDEIIEKLESHEFTIPVEDVRDMYSTKNPVYPMIAIDEINNSPYVQTLGKEKISDLSYRFEIYTRDKSVNGEALTKREIADTILVELDELLRTTYGFKRTPNISRLPYNTDGSVLRTIIMYSGKIDNDTMIMYQ